MKDLENLKKRFGDADLNKCEVMLNDVTTSRHVYENFVDKIACDLVQLKVGMKFLKLEFLLVPFFRWVSQRIDSASMHTCKLSISLFSLPNYQASEPLVSMKNIPLWHAENNFFEFFS